MTVLKSKNSGMQRAKIVLLGAPGVGKTSLVQRFVHSVFSETHTSTLGVKVDRKSVELDDRTVSLLIWDMHGETDGLDVPPNYLTGAAGGLVVFDRSRPETIDVALGLGERLQGASPDAKIFTVGNKVDLETDSEAVTAKLEGRDSLATSAKSGDGVEELFERVARSII